MSQTMSDYITRLTRTSQIFLHYYEKRGKAWVFQTKDTFFKKKKEPAEFTKGNPKAYLNCLTKTYYKKGLTYIMVVQFLLKFPLKIIILAVKLNID